MRKGDEQGTQELKDMTKKFHIAKQLDKLPLGD